MNTVAEVSLVVMAVVNLLGGLVALGVLFAIVRLFGKLWPALDRLEQGLRPGARKSRELLWKASRIADTVNEKADRVEATIARVDQTTEHMWNAAVRARAALDQQLIPVKSLLVGMRTGARVLSQEISRPKRAPRLAQTAPAQPPPVPSESWRAA
jgi:hypothetical protein